MFKIWADEQTELFEWWTTDAQFKVREKLDQFLKAQKLLRERLQIDLPDDWAKLTDNAAVEKLMTRLEQIPLCYLRKIGYELSYLATSPQEKTLAEKFHDKCREIISERPATLKKSPTVVKMSKVAQKFFEVQTPAGSTLEFFTVDDCEKIFVHGAQLAVACGYPNQSGTTSDNSDFGKAVNAVAKFYAMRPDETDKKARRFVDIEDVPAIVH